ncbi:MAG: hypothetical protein KGL35_07685, partial [Bradyrhizobium sp.]|nr:hypothetical protein [Bradyrhizobium sp.]
MNLYRHLSVGGRGERTPFTSPRSGGRPPLRDRYDHGQRVYNELTSATDQAITWLKEHRWTGGALGASGFYLEFLTRRFEPELFESKTHGIEVVAAVPVAEDSALMRVTLYVPQEARSFFQDKITAYLDESQDNKEGPANEQVVSRIEAIAFREPLELLWTDPPQWFPRDRDVEVWWEVWIKIDLEGRLIGEMRRKGIRYKPYYLTFPERYARLVRATPVQIEALLETGAIAELRRGTAAPSAVLGSSSGVQFDAIDELLERMTPPPGDAPSICLMDTGVNVAHPLLSVATSAGEAIAWDA